MKIIMGRPIILDISIYVETQGNETVYSDFIPLAYDPDRI